MADGRTNWTEAERETLRQLLAGGKTTAEAAEAMHRSIIAVRTAASRMGLVTWSKIPPATRESVSHYGTAGWSSSRIARRLRIPAGFVDALLDLVARGLTYREIAARIGRPAEGTRMRGHQLDVPYRRRRWNAVEDTILAAGVRDRTPFAELATRLYRSAGAVQVRASVLGLTNRTRKE